MRSGDKLNHPTTPDSTQKTRADRQKMKQFSREALKCSSSRRCSALAFSVQCGSGVQNSYSANISRIDRLYIYRQDVSYKQRQLPPLAFCMLYVVSVEIESMYVQYVVYNNDQIVYIQIFRKYVLFFEYALFYVQICIYFTNITKTMGPYAIFSCNLL